MKKTDLLIGFFMGIIACILGTLGFLFLKMPKLVSVEGFHTIREQGIMGRLITLGAVINLLLFFILLKKNKDLMARGVVLATIVLAFVTLFLQ
ncbi:hypothetical protein [Flavobacterium sp.]|jgi:hypothetical protein|uniref:hypothetical protein n=1 Tax=Flavobacterium sp. TaxID=239 RepID=UPI003BC7EAE6